MCIILDANCWGEFNDSANADMQPVRDWLAKRHGKIAHAHTAKFKAEWRGEPQRMRLEEWRRADKLRVIPAREVERESAELAGKIKSDDEHIVALARIAKVTLLVSHDEDLHDDFTNSDFIKGGKIYQTRRHKHLLTPDLCP